MHLTFEAFAQAHRGLSDEQLLRAVSAPHLLLRYHSTTTEKQGETFRTLLLGSSAGAALRGERLVLPIVKRPLANVFAMMVTVGRATNNDIVLTHPRVSKLQAYFTQRAGTWHVWDPVSSNGTLVDGCAVPRNASLPLHPSSVIEFKGAAEALFLSPPELLRLLRASGAELGKAPPSRGEAPSPV